MKFSNPHPGDTQTHHEYVPPTPAPDPLAPTGYVAKEYKREENEYPKHVNVRGTIMEARDAEHEKQLLAPPATEAVEPPSAE